VRVHHFIAVVLLAASPVPVAGASGTNSYTPPGQQEWQDLRDPYREAYDAGRRIMKREITCKTCPFPKGIKNRETALELIAKIQAGEIVLEEEKLVSLVHYLDKRFDIRRAN
jgi:hypothetical protein